MKKKKKLKNKIGAFVCALVVAVSLLGASVPYYADNGIYSVFIENSNDLYTTVDFEIPLDYVSSYDYYYVFVRDSKYCFLWGTNTPFVYSLNSGYNETSAYTYYNLYTTGFGSGGKLYVKYLDGTVDWKATTPSSWGLGVNYSIGSSYYIYDNGSTSYSLNNSRNLKLVTSNEPIYFDNGDIFLSANSFESPSYNYNLGYLQNVYEYKSYLEVPLGEVVNDKFSARWYFDNLTTTGIDLSSGNYTIRYYQERWLVSGYDLEDDVVEKSDRYLIGEYSANQRYIETNSEDIDLRLESLGYEEPGFFDLLWHKFVNTHHYFQVVDNDSGEVGGYLHIYYTDETGTFGAEYIGETVDENGDFDENGYKQVVNDESITSDSYEEGFDTLESGSNTDFGDIDGVNEFSSILTNYANGVANFGNALGVFLSAFPSWLLISVGIGVCLIVFCIVFKVLTR